MSNQTITFEELLAECLLNPEVKTEYDALKESENSMENWMLEAMETDALETIKIENEQINIMDQEWADNRQINNEFIEFVY